MKHLILHIGQYKTGSTSIQHTLDQARARLIEHGVLYPETGCFKSQHGLLTRKMKREVHNDRPGAFDAAPLLAEIEASDCEQVIISCEGISGGRMTRMQPPLVTHMLRSFGEIAAGCPITVVWYYRRQDEAIESRMVQTIKGQTGTTQFNLAPYLKADEALDYSFFQSVVAEALPQARIVPRCFARKLLAEGDVVRDFCKITGIDGALRPEDIVQTHATASGSLIGLRLALNLLAEAGHGIEPIFRAARRMSPQEDEEKALVLDADMRREAMAFFADSNARFIDQHVPAEERAAVTEYFAAPVSTRPPNITVSAEMLARALVHAGAEISYTQGRPRTPARPAVDDRGDRGHVVQRRDRRREQ